MWGGLLGSGRGAKIHVTPHKPFPLRSPKEGGKSKTVNPCGLTGPKQAPLAHCLGPSIECAEEKVAMQLDDCESTQRGVKIPMAPNPLPYWGAQDGGGNQSGYIRPTATGHPKDKNSEHLHYPDGPEASSSSGCMLQTKYGVPTPFPPADLLGHQTFHKNRGIHKMYGFGHVLLDCSPNPPPPSRNPQTTTMVNNGTTRDVAMRCTCHLGIAMGHTSKLGDHACTTMHASRRPANVKGLPKRESPLPLSVRSKKRVHPNLASG